MRRLHSVCKKTHSVLRNRQGQGARSPKKRNVLRVYEHFLDEQNAEIGVFLEKLHNLWHFLLVFIFMQAACVGITYGQNIESSLLISSNLGEEQTRVSLENVLDNIEKRYRVTFLYEEPVIAGKYLDSMQLLLGQAVGQKLAEVLTDLTLDYLQLDEETYVLVEKKRSPATRSQLQPETITGVVTDAESGETLPGVNVIVKGTTTGTSTDTEGNYELGVPSLQDTLIFSFVGYQQQEIPIDGRTEIDVSLQAQAVIGEEMVVVGYGTQRKSDVTGSVVSIDQSRLEQPTNTSFLQAIQGSVPGVYVRSNTGQSNEGASNILIRGRNSITASNNPLIILDGVPYPGNLSEINSSSVESIEVLKDASATAIYGSRAANGVILITTKKGKSGKTTISYSGSTGLITSPKPDILSANEYYDFKLAREGGDPATAFTSSEREIYNSGETTDWWEEATRTGIRQQHSLSFSGGNENISYYIAGNLLNKRGQVLNDNFKRYQFRANLEANATNWLKFGINSLFSIGDRSGITPIGGLLSSPFQSNPLTRVRDNAGDLILFPWPEQPTYRNPIARTKANNENKSYQVFGNLYMEIEVPFIKGLNYKLNTQASPKFNRNFTYWGRDTPSGSNINGQNQEGHFLRQNYLIENIISYDNAFGAHNISATALYSYQKEIRENETMTTTGFANDILTSYQDQNANSISLADTYTKSELLSQMLRINYNYDDKYLLTVTGRRDGASVFGQNHKWGLFPSLALGWRISNESFLNNNSLLSNLKLRVSYGKNGNQALNPYESLSRLASSNTISGNSSATGYISSQLANSSLEWETSITSNFGIDFGLINNRITGSVEAYFTQTKDLLLAKELSAVGGITSTVQNIGETKNKGLEFNLSSTNITNPNFGWTTNANFAFNQNQIVSLDGTGDDILNKWFIGKPITTNYDYTYDGVWQTGEDIANSHQPSASPGDVKIRDINGDKKIDDNDRDFLGQRDPQFTWGLANTLNYKGLKLYVFLQGVEGTMRPNLWHRDRVFTGTQLNTLEKNWWTSDNPTNEHWANRSDANPLDVIVYESSDYIRIKDVTMSYELPQSFTNKINTSALSVFISGRNLAVFTDWFGLDPEINSRVTGQIPLPSEFVIGLNLTL